jgi:ankyrin repeat protein
LDASLGTPLITAINNGDIKMVRLLLSKGADPNLKSSYGEFPLFIALQMEHRELIALLIKHGADPTTKNHEGKTPEEWLDAQQRIGLSLDKITQMKMWLTLYTRDQLKE